MQGYDWRPKSLTWKGHEFLDTIRNDTIWRQVKETIRVKGGTASLEIVKELAVQIAKRYFLEP